MRRRVVAGGGAGLETSSMNGSCSTGWRSRGVSVTIGGLIAREPFAAAGRDPSRGAGGRSHGLRAVAAAEEDRVHEQRKQLVERDAVLPAVGKGRDLLVGGEA